MNLDMSNLVEEYLKSKQIVDQKSPETDSLKSKTVTDPDNIRKAGGQDCKKVISRNILLGKI